MGKDLEFKKMNGIVLEFWFHAPNRCARQKCTKQMPADSFYFCSSYCFKVYREKWPEDAEGLIQESKYIATIAKQSSRAFIAKKAGLLIWHWFILVAIVLFLWGLLQAS